MSLRISAFWKSLYHRFDELTNLLLEAPDYFIPLLLEHYSYKELDKVYKKFVDQQARVRALHLFVLREDSISMLYPEVERVRVNKVSLSYLKGLNNLKSLDLSQNYLGIEGLLPLKDINLPSLTHLDLSDNQLIPLNDVNLPALVYINSTIFFDSSIEKLKSQV